MGTCTYCFEIRWGKNRRYTKDWHFMFKENNENPINNVNQLNFKLQKMRHRRKWK